MKLIAVLLNFLYYFYQEIPGDKTYNVVHGEAFEIQHEIIPILSMELKQHTESITNVKFASNFSQYVTKALFLTIV